MSAPVTPGGGTIGCPLVIGAVILAANVAYWTVHLIVWAVS